VNEDDSADGVGGSGAHSLLDQNEFLYEIEVYVIKSMAVFQGRLFFVITFVI
jgi:hypothetical protein